jgi:hypothetical protein
MQAFDVLAKMEPHFISRRSEAAGKFEGDAATKSEVHGSSSEERFDHNGESFGHALAGGEPRW